MWGGGCFPTIFLIHVYFNSIVVWKNIFYDVYSFKFVKVYVMGQNVVYINIPVNLRMYILLLLGGIVYKCQFDLIVISLQNFCLLDVSYWDSEVSNCNSGFVYISLQFYQFLRLVFWCPLVRDLHVKDYYIFLKYRSLYHYIMPLLIPENFLWQSALFPLTSVSRVYYSYPDIWFYAL